MQPATPIAIAGIGCICSAGLTLKEAMSFLYKGERRPAAPVAFATKTPLAFPVFEILEDFFPSEKIKAKNVLRTCMLALTATLEAMDNAGFDREFLKKKRVGVCIGTNVGSCVSNEAFYLNHTERDDLLAAPAERFMVSNPTRVIAAEFCTGGPLQTVVNACSAGSDAIGLAAAWIRAGLCEVVIAGGADALYPVTYTGFKSLLIYDDSPCKPFDAHRKGLNLGEGAAVLILAAEDILKKSGKKPRGYVCGYGSATDAYHPTKTRPDGLGLKMAIQEAVNSSGIAPAEIAFVNAHGTGTWDNDLIESRVLYALMPKVPFFSTKGYTGHTLGASGAIEAAFTVACLEEGRIPASAGFTTPDPGLAPIYPVSQNVSVNGRMALSETLAFGGNNAVLILRDKEVIHLKIGIKGIGVLGGFGGGVADLASALASGRSRESTVALETSGGRLEFPALTANTERLTAFVDKGVLRRLDHYIRMALLGSFLALEDAGMLAVRQRRMGIIVATGYGATCNLLDMPPALATGAQPECSPTRFSNSVHNAAATHISILLDEMSPSLSINDYDLSIPSAFLTACQWLREKRVEAVLVGGVDEYCQVLAYNRQRCGRSGNGAGNNFTDSEPQQAIIGEGAAFFVLTRAEDASPYGFIEAVRMGNSACGRVDLSKDAAFFLSVDGYGESGDQYAAHLPRGAIAAAYSHLYGSIPVGMGFDIAIAALSHKAGKIYRSSEAVRFNSGHLNAIRSDAPFEGNSICCLKLSAGGTFGWVRLARSGAPVRENP